MAGSFDKVFIDALAEVDKMYVGQDLVYEGISPAVITTHPVASGNQIAGWGAVQLCTAGVCSGGTIKYKAAGSSQTSYGTSIPTVASAGTYTLYYYAEGDATHTDSQEYSTQITISNLTNLVGTTWQLNSNAQVESGAYSPTSGTAVAYSVDVSNIEMLRITSKGKYVDYTGYSNTIYAPLKYERHGGYAYCFMGILCYSSSYSDSFNGLKLTNDTTPETPYLVRYFDGSDYGYRLWNGTFTITGGSDATNATLIAWILANCTRVS